MIFKLNIKKILKKASRPISTCKLNTLTVLTLHAYQPRSLRGVFRGPKPQRNLILQLASRLDAFSGYLFRT
jgi:hypothetical protein